MFHTQAKLSEVRKTEATLRHKQEHDRDATAARATAAKKKRQVCIGRRQLSLLLLEA